MQKYIKFLKLHTHKKKAKEHKYLTDKTSIYDYR